MSTIEEKLTIHEDTWKNTLKAVASRLTKKIEDLRAELSQLKEKSEKPDQIKVNCNCKNEVESLKINVKKMDDRLETTEFILDKQNKTYLDAEIKLIKDKCKNNKEKLDDVNVRLKSLEEDEIQLAETVRVSEEKFKVINTEIKNISENVNKYQSETRSDSTESTLFKATKMESNKKCKYCLQNFTSLDSLKNHILIHHKYEYKCKCCDKRFGNSYQMELHLMDEHKEEKSFKCNLCEAQFLVEWKLKKHVATHQTTIKVRTCHYFNNSKQCPYIKNGCKFLHKEAVTCKFAENCKKNKCQFKH